jgi:hypothetical protein
VAPHGREPVSDGEGAERRRERKGPVVAPVHVLRLCTITNEIPQDLDHALGAYEELGINTVELCVVGGVNVVSHDEAGIARKVATVEDRCVRVGATASLSSSATSIATASREAAHSWGSTYSVTYPTAGSSAR